MHLADAIIAAADPDLTSAAGIISSWTCGRFEFGGDVVDAANMVADSKPASIVAAIEMARLPYAKTWMEWLPWRAAVVSAGRMGLQPGATWVYPLRRGWLLSAEDDGWSAEPFALLAGDRAVRAPFTVRLSHDIAPPDVMRRWQMIQGMRAERQRLIEDPSTDPEVLRKVLRLSDDDLLATRMITDAIDCRDTAGRPTWSPETTGPARELLAVVLLLNSRNAVAIDGGPDLGRLNKARAKARKAPLVTLKPVVLDITRRLRAARRAGSNADIAQLRAHVVRGHFKMRRTGVFWWSPYVRSGMVEIAEQPRDYQVRGKFPGPGNDSAR